MTGTEVMAVIKTTEDRAYQEDVLAVMLEFSQMPYATDDGWMIEAMATRIVALQDALREAIRDNTANADALDAAQRRVEVADSLLFDAIEAEWFGRQQWSGGKSNWLTHVQAYLEDDDLDVYAEERALLP